MTTTAEQIDAWKKAAADAAVAEVQDGMLVGLGTGSTAAHALAALARRVRQGLHIEGVATSHETERQAHRLGITLRSEGAFSTLDLAIDGADELDPQLRAIKGGGGAMVREKIVAQAARRMIAIVDATKTVERLGQRPIPVEVVPFALGAVSRAIEALGGRPVQRMTAEGAHYCSDNGNPILDCGFHPLADPERLGAMLDAVPGLVGHGLFLTEIDVAYVAGPDGVARVERGR